MKPCPLAWKGISMLSPPTRGAWIETTISLVMLVPMPVAPHTGGVD